MFYQGNSFRFLANTQIFPWIGVFSGQRRHLCGWDREWERESDFVADSVRRWAASQLSHHVTGVWWDRYQHLPSEVRFHHHSINIWFDMQYLLSYCWQGNDMSLMTLSSDWSPRSHAQTEKKCWLSRKIYIRDLKWRPSHLGWKTRNCIRSHHLDLKEKLPRFLSFISDEVR